MNNQPYRRVTRYLQKKIKARCFIQSKKVRGFRTITKFQGGKYLQAG